MPEDYDFDAALAAQVESANEEPVEEPDPDVHETEDHVLDTDESLAEPEIVGPEAEEQEEEEEAAPAIVQEPVALDARATEYLSELVEHFDGDHAKALRSAVEAQGLIGRQGQELGELRKEVEAIRAGQQGQPKQPQPFPGDLDDAIEENPSEVAKWALEQNQAGVYNAAMISWYEENPRDAGRFERALEMDMMRRELEENFRPVIEPARQQTQARTMAQAQQDLRVSYPDLDSILESATEAEVQGLDATVIRQLQETNPKAALETIYRWVKAGRPPEPQAASPEQQAAARAVKRDAAVVNTSSTPVREDKGNYDRLKEFMLAPDAHSVSHGLQR